MLSRVVSLVLISLFAGLAAETTAQSAKSSASSIFRLRDGSAFEGRILRESRENLIIRGEFGNRRLEKSQVLETVAAAATRDNYQQKLQVLPEKDPKARVMMAEWCRQAGLTSAFRAELNTLLAHHPHHEAAWDMVRREAPLYVLVENPAERSKPRWAREQVDLLFSRAAKADAALTAMIAAQMDTLEFGLQLEPALDYLRRGTAMQRVLASRILGNTRDVRRVKPLYTHALADPEQSVRFESVAALQRSGDGEIKGPFVKQLLNHEHPTVRLYAAEALGQIGAKNAVPALVAALGAPSPGVTKSNLSVLTQTSYVKDFDVEIASGAVIADPVVDIVRSGVVHEVGLVSIAAMRAGIHKSLQSLTGESIGPDAAAWRQWLKTNPDYAALKTSGR